MPSTWLTWTPKTANGVNAEPSKPTEPNFDGFDGGGVYTSPKFTTQKFHRPTEGQRVFPHCPRCASYDLYRKDNQGDYECETCGLNDISETVARRIQ